MIINTRNLFPIIKNRSNFVFEHPYLHPHTEEYAAYWNEQLTRIIEGYWGIDSKNPREKSWRYMSPALYYYTNIFKILLIDSKNKRSSLSRPWLLDIIWTYSYLWLICKGFSGFEKDEEYTCHWTVKLIEDRNINPELPELDPSQYALLHMSCYKKNGTLKKYIDPLEYLNKTHEKNLGLPLYFNKALNIMVLGCHGEDVKVKMYEGGEKSVKDIKIGDKVLNKIGTYNTVKELHNGLAPLYTISSKYSSDFTVTAAHTLILNQYTKQGVFKKQGMFGMEELDFVNYKYEIVTNECKYNTKDLPLDPYFVGLWLGDGFKREKMVCVNQKEDWEILEWLKKYGEEVGGYSLKESKNGLSDGYTTRVTIKHNGLLGKNNYFAKTFRNNKNIPDEYMFNSRENRLKLLAGYIDSDGNLDNNRYNITSVDLNLLKQTQKLAQSLNFRAVISKPQINGIANSIKYNLRITGNIKEIPILTSRKKIKNTNQIFHRNFINISKIEIKDFYGFNLDGDHEYIINENILTHNARGGSKTYFAAAIISQEFLTDGCKTLHEYDEKDENGNRIAKSIIFAGAPLAGKAMDLIKKVEEGFNNMPGVYKDGSKYYPAPLSKAHKGSFKIDAEYISAFDKQVGDQWVTEGGNTFIKMNTFFTNKQAAAGPRYTTMIIDEVGLEDKLLTVHGSNEFTMKVDSVKFGSAWYGGCVCAGTKVWTKDGKLVNIEDLKQEDGILGWKKDGISLEDISFMQEPSKKECVKITLESGKTLSCSIDHPILSGGRASKKWEKGYYQKTAFVEAAHLHPGDYVFSLDKVDIFGIKSLKEARLIGLLIGDGYYGGSHVSLSTDQKGIQDYIESNFIFTKHKEFKIKNDSEVYIEYTFSKLRPLIREMGMEGQKKLTKRLPKDIHLYDKQSLSELLGGYFDADGAVTYNKKKNVTRITLTSIVYELLEEVKYQLTKFGIDSSITKEKSIGGYTPDSIKYVLYINKNEDVKRFRENITFLSENKQKTLNEFVYGNRSFGRPDIKLLSKDNIVSANNVVFNRIKSIENIGEQYIYNLTADNTNTYLANNIITHNTGGDMDKVVESEIIFRDPIAYDMLGFEDVYENRGHIGFFLPAEYTNFSYKDEEGNTILDQAVAYETYQRTLKKKAKNNAAYDEYIMGKPRVPSEIFLSKSGNKFPQALLRLQQADNDRKKVEKYIESIGVLESCDKSTYKVKFSPANLKPLRKYQLDSNPDLKGALVVYEHPPALIPNNLYKVVYDPVRDENGGTSLASIIVYKGRNTIDHTGNMIVAHWAGRYDSVDAIHEICCNVAKYFNAQVMFENNIPDFKNYCLRTNQFHLLAPTPYQAISKAIKEPSKKWDVGIPMSKPLGEYAEKLALQWLLTDRKTWEEDGEEHTLKNYQTIYDNALLDEFISYNSTGNFDRVSAFKLLMLWLIQEDEEVQSYNALQERIAINDFYTSIHTPKKVHKSLIY